MDDYLWMTEARRHIGLREIPGPKTNNVISRWLQQLKAWWADDETPWCGTFVAGCLDGLVDIPAYWMRAKAWAAWGRAIGVPAYGCIVVFERSGGGHVGFLAGIAEDGRLMILGGNQQNSVSIAPFDRGRVISYRWPPGLPVGNIPMPTLLASGSSSSNEA